MNINIDEDGWVVVDELRQKSKISKLTLKEIQYIVDNNDKKRYEMKNVNGKYFIKAS